MVAWTPSVILPPAISSAKRSLRRQLQHKSSTEQPLSFHGTRALTCSWSHGRKDSRAPPLLPHLHMSDQSARKSTICSKKDCIAAQIRRNEYGFRQIFVTIREVSPNICEKSCQKSVTISATSRSTLLSFCQIFG